MNFHPLCGRAASWARGAMDNASDYGSEDSRFESWRARKAFLVASKFSILSILASNVENISHLAEALQALCREYVP